jgi:hypothetical protein
MDIVLVPRRNKLQRIIVGARGNSCSRIKLYMGVEEAP